mmetsp:Transcript_4442/g.9703  ORF Transcript_4442/g.9703 Transcript_4442/m.9703 type:complete len:168 (-) Transcript_4442:238-741(-)
MILRVAQPAWFQRIVAEQIGKSEGRTYVPAPFLFAVQGDFLKFDAAAAAKYGFENFDAAFDRGSCVAVTPADRPQYAQTLTSLISPGGKLLLVAVEHEPAFGPPYSVDEAEVTKLFGGAFDIKQLSREDRIEAEPVWKQRGATAFQEVVYLCTKRGEKKAAAEPTGA